MSKPIYQRMNQRMVEDDRKEIQRALLDYAIDTECECSKLAPNHYLLQKLLPYLHTFSANWKQLQKNPDWVGSVAHKHVLEYLKNQLR